MMAAAPIELPVGFSELPDRPSRPVLIDVLIPTYRHFDSQAFIAIQSMMNFTKVAGYDVHCPAHFMSGVIHWARNDAIRHVRPRADFVLFCDDDMVPDPDALAKLAQLSLPVVSALTTSRSIPPKLSVRAYSEEHDTFCRIEAVAPNRIIGLTGVKIGVGAGFLLLKRRVLMEAVEFHLDARDWAATTKPLFDRLGTSEEQREQERKRLATVRRARQKAGKSSLLFDFWEGYDGEPHGEDMVLCRKLIQMGVRIAVDTSVQVGHLGPFPYGPWNLDQQDAREVKVA